MEVPLGNGTERRSGASYPRPERRNRAISRGLIPGLFLLATVREELSYSAQAVEVEKRGSGVGREERRRTSRIVGSVESNGSVAAVGQADDNSGLSTASDSHDGQSLPAERVMGMGDGDPSRRNLGKRGSALGVCLPSATAWFRGLSSSSWNQSSRRTFNRARLATDRGGQPMRRCNGSPKRSSSTRRESSTSTCGRTSIRHLDTPFKNASS